MTVLDELVEKNVYPIVFIGSGISKRYLKDFPNWDDLIKRLWKKAFSNDEDDDFYRFMNQMREDIMNEHADFQTVKYLTNIKASSEIEKNFNRRFISGEIKIEDYTAKDYFEEKISPFKVEIANIFKNYEVMEKSLIEYELFKQFLSKTKIILTTNYDTLLEDSIRDYSQDSKLDVFIGQKGFLRDTTGWSELYKVHGSVSEPGSIVITEEDYKAFDEKSVLISAKIISSLIDAPIIFLGYSLNDVNIRRIISDFAGSIEKEDMVSGAERIIMVERKAGEEKIIETKTIDQDLGIDITVISTDNYQEIFEKLNNIDEGLPSSFINRYQSFLKELIVERGREGILQTLLVSPVEMDELEQNEQLRKNAAVVLADSSIVFVYPDVVTYFIDYFTDTQKINCETALRYIASQTTTTRLPFYLFLNDVNLDKTGLPTHIKDKIISRKSKYSKLNDVTKSIPHYNKIVKNHLEEIEEMDINEKRKTDIIAFNIERLDKDLVKAYLIEKLNNIKKQNEYTISTEIRRLALCFDVLYNKKD
ncbi:hypothetical protein CUM63_10200 [Enterococcus faecium]|uniref:SIR2 family protein n=1 Tax=Enterococcus faecium TaxID=1352 RepID=UPI000CF236CE|nr:SIR2 family protein [Enterococcus faecium]AVL46141.1 hypothetical protein CEQ01_13275 [Enterococcus faecium]MCO5449596.1 SIR2 family protein [Enterococcus faecium]PQD30462.1 hypothetical protein CUM63_10200 [Enterococcus faecium]